MADSPLTIYAETSHIWRNRIVEPVWGFANFRRYNGCGGEHYNSFPYTWALRWEEPEQLSRWCMLLKNGWLAQLSIFGESAGICGASGID